MYTELFNPIYATRDGLPVIIVGVVRAFLNNGAGELVVPQAVVIDDDGRFSFSDFSDLIADVRYRDGRWHDVSPQEGDDGEG